MTPSGPVSVVIPCFNDRHSLPAILTTLNQPLIGQVIVVDDGSSPPLPASLTTFHPNLLLIRHRRNLGKSRALQTGLKQATCPTILFLDSDLVGLTSAHVRSLVTPVIEHRFDLVIGEVSGLLPIFRLVGYSVAYSGLRCFNQSHRRTLNRSLNHRGYLNGFLAEADMNTYFFGKKKVKAMALIGLGQSYKISKFGLKGLFNDFKIMAKIASYLGLSEHLSQLSYSRRLLARH